MLDGASVPIVIIGYRTPEDIRGCLAALARAEAAPSFAVMICENGGAAAFDALLARLTAPDSPCVGLVEALDPTAQAFLRVRRLRLGPRGETVVVAEARENLGYAGGINACLTALAPLAGWTGVWVLNPDTEPAPDALAEMVAYAKRRDKGMVGSRLMYVDNPDIVRTRGLKWRKFRASTMGIDNFAPVAPAPDSEDVERRMDSPSGASFYITRDCIERIGPMDERYFLYYEDLDWGMRAKASCGIGYAYAAVVPHVGGASIGSAQTRAARSQLAVYLDFRNRLIFVRSHYPAWFAWTAAMAFVRASEYLVVGAGRNFVAALRGILAGLGGETGRPDHIMDRAAAPSRP